ncbi:D-alanyl-D-alanine carboxypeptidase [Sphingorhabdus lutea]|uniref:serine-type D-Ala-D-Ala carboxypeptidase n=1 Tax=Sphingorhabdus lutea TaxID=1913578 RepID=A0A1L3JC70_9SPHN|nr:D-alanyl-D-alanine carboxypeptidase family protein [Sphingorhabdus lutea]APG62699.1 D-alanyl-D-alanine carboxypeptidase [Sphingorhabdus lutea]
MSKIIRIITGAVAFSAIIQPVGAASTFDAKAPIAYMIDLSSGAILYARDENKQIPPASMAKMMTVYVAFDQIKQGKLKLNQKITVRPDTWKKWNNQGSTMFLKPNEQVTVADLLHGIVTLSGNDASVVLAEGIAGSEAEFVNLMNVTAKKIGLNNSRFGTCNGWPDEGRTLVTAKDLGVLGQRTIYDFPKLYKEFYGLSEFKWNGISQPNRNPILGKIAGADGLKTGHTEEAGYGFAGTAEQNGRRIVMVVAGLDSFNGRVDESVRFMNWGFQAWTTKPLYKSGNMVYNVPVQLGSQGSIDAIAPRDLAVTMPKSEDGPYKLFVRYKGPIKAPIKAGDVVAHLVVKPDNGAEQSMELVASEDVNEAGFFGRLWNGFKAIFGF